MSDLVTQFKDNLQEDIEQFKHYIDQQDMQGLAKQSHRLIGASQLFGFHNLANIAVELETCAKENDLQNIEILLQTLFDEITSRTS